MIKLILCGNEATNRVQIYVTICLIIKVVCNLTPGHKRLLPCQLSKMGV